MERRRPSANIERDRRLGRLNMDLATSGALTVVLGLFTKNLVQNQEFVLAGFTAVATLGGLYFFALNLQRRIGLGRENRTRR